MVLIKTAGNVTKVNTPFDDCFLFAPKSSFLILNLLMKSSFLWNRLPGALQWQWFVHVGILSVSPATVERKDSPQHDVSILRQLGVLRISSQPADGLLSLRERRDQ